MTPWSVRVAAVAGAACLAPSGWAGTVAAAMVLGGVLGGQRLRVTADWTWSHVGALLLCGGAAWSVGVVPGFALLLGWLAAHRAVVATGVADQRVQLLLATLMVLVGTVGSVSLLLVPALLAFAIATPLALLRLGGLTDKALSVGTCVATVLLAAAFFVVVPRLRGGFLGGPDGAGGPDRLAEQVALGDELEDPDREALLMRVRMWARDGSPRAGPIYLRGRSLDHFDGRAWSSTGTVQRVAFGAWETRTEVMLEPLEGATVFGPPDVLYAKSDQGPILQGPGGELQHFEPGRRTVYEVYSRAATLGEPEPGVAALLQLPELEPRVVELASTLAPGSDDARVIVAAALRTLASGYAYDPEPPEPGADPLTWFLFESRAGHCEYFASALAVLLRARGVPARLATGFYTEERSTTGGYYAVRRGHAHAWVEVPVRSGWAVVDATPVGGHPEFDVPWWRTGAEAMNEAWLSLVLDFDIDRQMDAAASLGQYAVAPIPNDPIRSRGRTGMVGAGIVLAALTLSGSVLRGVLWWLARPSTPSARPDEVVDAFRAARRRVVRRGWLIPEHLAPLEAGDWLVANAGELGEPLRSLAWVLYRARYGGEAADMVEVRRLQKAARALPKP